MNKTFPVILRALLLISGSCTLFDAVTGTPPRYLQAKLYLFLITGLIAVAHAICAIYRQQHYLRRHSARRQRWLNH